MMIEFVDDPLLNKFFDLGKITDPAKLVHIAFDLDNQMISMAVKVLTFPIYRTFKLVCRFEIEMLSDLCLQEPPNFSLFATL